MKDLVAVLKSSFESIDCQVEYADVFEEFMEETGELEIIYGNVGYCVYVYHAQEELPGLIKFGTVPANLGPLYSVLKKTITDKGYSLEKYGETQDKELYLRATIDKKKFNIYFEKIEGSKPNYGVF